MDTARARAELAKHTSVIRMTPEVDADGTLQYVAEGEWNFFGGTDFAVVAGVGGLVFRDLGQDCPLWAVRLDPDVGNPAPNP